MLFSALVVKLGDGYTSPIENDFAFVKESYWPPFDYMGSSELVVNREVNDKLN